MDTDPRLGLSYISRDLLTWPSVRIVQMADNKQAEQTQETNGEEENTTLGMAMRSISTYFIPAITCGLIDHRSRSIRSSLWLRRSRDGTQLCDQCVAPRSTTKAQEDDHSLAMLVLGLLLVGWVWCGLINANIALWMAWTFGLNSYAIIFQ